MPWNHYLNFGTFFDFSDFPALGDDPLNQSPLWSMRERLFYVLFERMATTYCSFFWADCRKLLDKIFLVFAVVPLLVLLYVHTSFIQTPANCLAHVSKEWPRDGILRVELNLLDSNFKLHDSCAKCASIQQLYLNEDRNFVSLLRNKSQPLSNQTYFVENNDFSNSELLPLEKSGMFENESFTSDYIQSTFNYLPSVTIDDEHQSHVVWPQQKYVIEYTLEYGLLKLSPVLRKKLKIPVLIVKLNPYDEKCFGNAFSQFLLKYIVGFTDVLMSSLKNLVDKDVTKGFVRNVVTGDQYRFINKSLTSTSYVIAAFTMVAFTLSISMLLRYSHHQIFLFIVRMLQALEFNLSTSFPAASLLTVVFALVGLEAVMSEFFNDNTTAFYIILIVWVADQYDTVCCHHPITKRHWLRFFYLYHFAFYAYDYRFNGQYSGLALFTSWMFIQHSMLYFFHHFELTSVLQNNEEVTENNAPPTPNYSLFLRERPNSNSTRNSASIPFVSNS